MRSVTFNIRMKNMCKRLIGLGFLLLLLMNTSLAQSNQSENELLWEISGNGLKQKSYLYGNYHSNDKRIFRLSDSTYFALDKSQAIVLETDVFAMFEDWDTRKEEVLMLFDNQGIPYTASNNASKTIYGDEDGMPQFLDAYFLEYCHNSNKKFYPLEDVQDQLDLGSGWVNADNTVIGKNTQNLTQDKMLEIYLTGDISTIDRVMRANMSMYPGLYEDIIVNRNLIMAKGIDTLIKKNSVFCAVGAGHLAGETGIINLLRKKGYHLRIIPATFADDMIPEKKNVRSKRNYFYVNDTIGIEAVFPGKPLELKIWDNHPYLVYREMGQGNTYSIEMIPIDGSLTLEEQAAIYIASPDATTFKHTYSDDGTDFYEGLSDTYPEGMQWVRLLQSDKYLLIVKAYGGNKFMNSNRPKLFFSKVWFE